MIVLHPRAVRPACNMGIALSHGASKVTSPAPAMATLPITRFCGFINTLLNRTPLQLNAVIAGMVPRPKLSMIKLACSGLALNQAAINIVPLRPQGRKPQRKP